jgi:hypothetical protein
MGLTKFAAFDIEAAELAPGASAGLQRTAAIAVAEKLNSSPTLLHIGWTKQAHRHEFDYVPRPGFLYVRSRAISSRINDNFDGFPAEEIKKAYATFKGKPVFVNHHNSNHRRARGVIIDAALHEDINPDGTPDTWCEVLMEVDATKFPKLAQAILAGHIDRTSMGTDVAYSICTFCNNKASTPLQYCAHIPRLKGKRIHRTTASGGKEAVLVAEMCYGLGFFENSLLVEPPADPTAFTFGVDARGLGVTASQHVANMPLADMQRMEQVLQEHMGHYNGNISWLLQNRPDATAEQVAGKIEDRDSQALQKMTGHEGWIVDKAEWWPKLIAACQTMLDEIRSGSTEAALHVVAIGEVKAPPKVDTMRDTKCPVCGEEDGFNGTECAVCQFVKPPDMFMDPDTELAGKVDLRQEQQDGLDDMEDATGTGDLVCDNCGTEFDDPDAQTPDPEAEIIPEKPVQEKPDEPAANDPARKVAPGEKVEVEVDKGKDDKPDFLKDKDKKPGDDGDGSDPATDEKLVDEDADDENAEDPETTQPKAGDTCPDCGKGVLQKKSPLPEGDKPKDDEEPDKPKSDAGSKDPEKDDDKKKSAPPWAKKSSHRGSTQAEGVPSMPPRPFHIVAAEQQASIDYIVQGMERIAALAGVPLGDLQQQRQQRVASIRRVALNDPQVNPAQPPGFAVAPTPGSEAPAQSTQEAATPTATDDVTQPGATPLTNVAPDAQTALSDSGPVLDAPLDLNEQDVTAPVAGTEQVRPEGETRTETEIRAGTPSDTGTAFPLQGPFAQTAAQQPVAPTPMEQAQARFFAGQRLANLRIQAGVDPNADAQVLGQQIATNAALTDGAIIAEIETLTKVIANRPASTPQVRTAGAGAQRRTMPSMVTSTSGMGPIEANLDPATGGNNRPTDDEFLFEGIS